MADDTSMDTMELLSPCFWVRKWRDSLLKAPYTAVDSAFWDTASLGYDDGFDARARKTLDDTVGLFHRHGILAPGARVLDIGCGTGTLALALAREGAEVTAVDFSEGMLGRLREKQAPEPEGAVHPVHADWGEVDLGSRGWSGQFDLVIANMTPAMRTPEAFTRMQAASRGWCFLKGWAQRRRNTALEELWPRVMDSPRDERPPEILFQLNLLYAQGSFPEVSFEELQWEKTVALEDAARYFIRYFAGISSRTEAQLRDVVYGCLEGIAEDGLVRERSRGWTGSLLWRVG